MAIPALLSFNAEAAASVAINSTNFPDANFRTVVKEYDTSKDGYLSSTEISRVINIHCEGCRIKSIKGVEFFTALEGLWCANNSISSMNISKNKNLHAVWCSGNPLTSLDFSGNPELEWVYCFDCKLTSLDFSNNPHLSYLECNTNTGLKSLNISKNAELEHLMCGSCALNKLDFSANPRLTHLDAFRNNMTSLNITKNTKLKRLNVWDNPGLGNVSISHLPELQYYNCMNNKVTEIDVTNNKQLQKLVVSCNSIKTLDLSKNPRLAYLDIGSNPIADIDLSNNPQLYFFQSYINQFTTLNIGNNSRLIKTYKDGTKKNEPNVAGYSYSINYGGSDEFGDELLYFLCVGNNCTKIVTTASNVHDIPDSTTEIDSGSLPTDDFMTREMVMETLYELAGSPSVAKLKTTFTDVDSGAWYENALKWGQNKKISLGYPNICSDTFGIGVDITRQDLALMLHRYATVMDYKTGFDYGRTDWFDDFKKIDYYAWGPFTWAIQWEYLVPDKSGKYADPRGKVSRTDLENAIKAMLEDNGRPVPNKIPIPSSEITDLVKVEAKAATCTENGNSAYWKSKSSGKYYKDALAKTEIAFESWIIPALGHVMSHVNAKAETCTTAGNIECYKCTRCEKFFADQDGNQELAQDQVIIPATGHAMEKTEAKEATCTEDGNSEYWTCRTCGKFFADADGEKEIKENSWIINASHHGEDNVIPATLKKNGRIVTTCTVCGEIIKDVAIPHIDSVTLKAEEYTPDSGLSAFVVVTDAEGDRVSSEYYDVVVKDVNGNEVAEPKTVGTYTLSVIFKGNYSGKVEDLEFTVSRRANTLSIKGGKTYKVKYKKLKKAKKKISYTSVISFYNKGQGGLVFVKKSGNKKITITKSGRVTIKKKLKKGTYKVKVTVRALGNDEYAPSATKAVIFKIRVK